jgi:hypothetical protein
LGAMITHPRSPVMGGSHPFRFLCKQGEPYPPRSVVAEVGRWSLDRDNRAV